MLEATLHFHWLCASLTNSITANIKQMSNIIRYIFASAHNTHAHTHTVKSNPIWFDIIFSIALAQCTAVCTFSLETANKQIGLKKKSVKNLCSLFYAKY